LRDIPCTLRGPKGAGRFNFYLPSLAGVHLEDLARASQWLSQRDLKDWSALKLAGLSAVGTIERWLLPQAVTPPEDPANEMRRVRQLAQTPDREAAANLWTSGATLASRERDRERETFLGAILHDRKVLFCPPALRSNIRPPIRCLSINTPPRGRILPFGFFEDPPPETKSQATHAQVDMGRHLRSV
jgi:hypothetical protein